MLLIVLAAALIVAAGLRIVLTARSRRAKVARMQAEAIRRAHRGTSP